MIIDHKTEQRLFLLLRMALWRRCVESAIFEGITDAEWGDIYRTALAQGVLAIAFDGMRMLPDGQKPDIDTRVQWAYNVEHIGKVSRQQIDAARHVAATFAAGGIRTMIMKGLSIACYYPDPQHRQFGDIDVYLMGDYARGNEIVRSQGIEVKYDYFVHSEFRMQGVTVENHLYFVNPHVNRTGACVQRALETVAGDARPHPIVEGALAPSPEFNALFLTRHATWHYARECIRLRDLCDWAVFLNAEAAKMDTAFVMNALRESGLERYASVVTTICRKYLGLEASLPFAEEYPALAERVKDDIMSFENPDKHKKSGVLKVFMLKIRNRLTRKWCYDEVVPDSYWGNIFYSIKNYIMSPLAIFRAKL